MATKTLETISVRLIGTVGDQITYAFVDRTDDPIASYMLDSFRRGDIMHGVTATGNKEIYIPFHAVDSILVYEQTASVPDRPDPYGCDEPMSFETVFEGNAEFTYQQMPGIYSASMATTSWSPKIGDTVAVTNSNGGREVGVISYNDGAGARADFASFNITFQLSQGGVSSNANAVARSNPGFSITKVEVGVQ